MNKRVLYKGHYQQLVKVNHWEYVERVNCSGIVIIIPLLQGGQSLLVEQYRIPVQSRVLEFPAGLVGDIPGEAEESMKKAAGRELWEETGYEAGKMTHLTQGPPSPGICSEMIDFFLAQELKKTGPGGGDDSEDIMVHKIDMKTIDVFLKEKQKSGLLIDPKVYTGLWFIQKYLKTQ